MPASSIRRRRQAPRQRGLTDSLLFRTSADRGPFDYRACLGSRRDDDDGSMVERLHTGSTEPLDCSGTWSRIGKIAPLDAVHAVLDAQIWSKSPRVPLPRFREVAQQCRRSLASLGRDLGLL